MKAITDEPFFIRSALRDIYVDLVQDKKLFEHNYHLFTFGLVYGLLHDKKYPKKPNADFTKLNSILDDVTKRIIDLVFFVLDDGRDSKEIWDEMLQIADGGVDALKEIYAKNKDFNIQNLILESQSIWKKKVKELHNINIQSKL